VDIPIKTGSADEENKKKDWIQNRIIAIARNVQDRDHDQDHHDDDDDDNDHDNDNDDDDDD
jgi:hypothetical protein